MTSLTISLCVESHKKRKITHLFRCYKNSMSHITVCISLTLVETVGRSHETVREMGFNFNENTAETPRCCQQQSKLSEKIGMNKQQHYAPCTYRNEDLLGVDTVSNLV